MAPKKKKKAQKKQTKKKAKKTPWDSLSQALNRYTKKLEKTGYDDAAARKLKAAIRGYEEHLQNKSN